MTRNDENFKISPPGEMVFKLGQKVLSDSDGVQEWKFDVSTYFSRNNNFNSRKIDLISTFQGETGTWYKILDFTGDIYDKELTCSLKQGQDEKSLKVKLKMSTFKIIQKGKNMADN